MEDHGHADNIWFSEAELERRFRREASDPSLVAVADPSPWLKEAESEVGFQHDDSWFVGALIEVERNRHVILQRRSVLNGVHLKISLNSIAHPAQLSKRCRV